MGPTGVCDDTDFVEFKLHQGGDAIHQVLQEGLGDMETSVVYYFTWVPLPSYCT